ncbi:MAG: hypothetical protein IKR84_02300, partial [Oscillibacter sp.]|nr:hypothetical protein [Oscillibacter sp.]
MIFWNAFGFSPKQGFLPRGLSNSKGGLPMKKDVRKGVFLLLLALLAALATTPGADAVTYRDAQWKNSAKRWGRWALTLAMLVGLLPGMGMTALAYDGNPFTALVNTTTAVKFNDMDWYIIADNSTAVNAGTVTLLAKNAIAAKPFLENGPTICTNDGSTSYKYSESTVKTYLDGLTNEGGIFAAVAKAIAPTNLTDVGVSNAKIFLPSPELNSLSSDVLKCATLSGQYDSRWWRRTKGNWDTSAGAVKGDIGENWTDLVVGFVGGVRPALNLDLSKVLFDTAEKTFSLLPPVKYQDAAWNASTKTVDFTEKTCEDYTAVTSDTTAWGAGWYVVNSDVTIDSRITVTGEVHLILVDGKTLTASQGVTVGTGAALNIYAQSGGTGTLRANGYYERRTPENDFLEKCGAGIGG